MLQTLGREGVAELFERHCAAAARFASACASIPGARILNDVVLNEVAVTFGPSTDEICDRVNTTGRFFLRTADWRGAKILMVTFCGCASTARTADDLASVITESVYAIAHGYMG